MRFLLLSSSGQYSCLKSIVEELKKRGHQYVHKSQETIGDKKNNIKDLHKKPFDAVIMTDYKFIKYAYCKGVDRPIVSTVHHGLGLKIPVDFLDNYFTDNRVDIVFVAGNIYYDTLTKYRDRLGDIYITGFPKTDYLISNKDQVEKFKKDIIKKYNIENNNPIVLYAPTWSRRDYSYGTLKSFQDIYNHLDKEFNIIVAPHPSDMRWLRGFLNIKNFDNVYLYDNVSKEKMILGSDIVISDNSSIAMEAALIDKPIIHLVNFYAPETMHLCIDKSKPCVKLGEILSLPNQIGRLKETIYNSIINEPYKMEKKYWVSKFCGGCNGDSTNKVIDILEMRHLKRNKNENTLD